MIAPTAISTASVPLKLLPDDVEDPELVVEGVV